MFAVNKLQSIGIRFINQPFFIKLIGKADAVAGADSIQTKVVTELIGGDAGFDIVALDRAGKSPDGFVFRSFAMGAGINAGSNGMHFAAAGGTGIAAHIPYPQLAIFRSSDFLIVDKLPVAEIAHRENPDGVGDILGIGRAPFLVT